MMRIDQDNVFSDRYLLTSYNVDRFYQARLSSFFSIIQDVAANHAYIRDCSLPHLKAEGRTWVIARSVVDIYSYPKWPEYVDVKTWPMEYNRYLAPRGTFIYSSDGKKIAESFTNWCIVDIDHAHRPVKPDFLSERLPSVNPEAKLYRIGNTRERIAEFDSIEGIKTLITKKANIVFEDSDYNSHLNNISYINWIMQSLPEQFLIDYLAYHVDISFHKETHLEDDLIVHIGASDINEMKRDDVKLICKITRGSDLVCTATLCFKRREAFSS